MCTSSLQVHCHLQVNLNVLISVRMSLFSNFNSNLKVLDSSFFFKGILKHV
jgi:hypothetical protein